MSKNITIYYNNNFYVKEESGKKLKHCPDEEYLKNSNTLNFLLNHFRPKKTDMFMFLISGYIDFRLKSIIKFIKKNKIRKIYIFIEDVFRIRTSDEHDLLQTYPIESNTTEYTIPELEIITNICKLTPEVKYEIYHCEYNVSKIEEKYDIELKFFDTFFHIWVSGVNQNEINETFEFNNNFKYKLSCFNLRAEYHRFLMAALLHSEEETLITLNHRYSELQLLNNKSLPFIQFENDFKLLLKEKIDKLDFKNLTWDVSLQDLMTKDFIDLPHQQQSNSIYPMSESFVNIVTETRYSSPMIYVSEKTLKPIVVFRPFILVAPPKSLAFLKQLGFKTFENFWDEGYDNIYDHSKRFEVVYQLIQGILKKTNNELKKMLEDMKPILIHNKNHLKSDFGKIFLNLNR